MQVLYKRCAAVDAGKDVIAALARIHRERHWHPAPLPNPAEADSRVSRRTCPHRRPTPDFAESGGFLGRMVMRESESICMAVVIVT